MKILSFVFLVLFLSSCAIPQAVPGLNSNKVTHDSNIYTGTEEKLTVRVRAILLRTDDGQGNFNMNNPEEAAIIREGISNALNNFDNWQKPADLEGCYTGNDFFPTTGINFELEFVSVDDTYGWNYLNSGSDLKKGKLAGFSPSSGWYLKKTDDSLHLSNERAKAIHIYFTMDGEQSQEILFNQSRPVDPNGTAAGQYPSSTDLNRSSQVHMPNVYLKYKYMREVAPKDFRKPWKEVKNWFLVDGSKGLTHELLHVFGLAHNNQYHKANQCGYSIMSQKHKDPRNYLQPTEIQKIHENFTKTNLMQFITDDSHYGKTILIKSNENWTEKKRYYSDFRLDDDVVVHISNQIILPVNSKFSLGNNAKIVIENGGSLTYPNGIAFDGWEKSAGAQVIEL